MRPRASVQRRDAVPVDVHTIQTGRFAAGARVHIPGQQRRVGLDPRGRHEQGVLGGRVARQFDPVARVESHPPDALLGVWTSRGRQRSDHGIGDLLAVAGPDGLAPGAVGGGHEHAVGLGARVEQRQLSRAVGVGQRQAVGRPAPVRGFAHRDLHVSARSGRLQNVQHPAIAQGQPRAVRRKLEVARGGEMGQVLDDRGVARLQPDDHDALVGRGGDERRRTAVLVDQFQAAQRGGITGRKQDQQREGEQAQQQHGRNARGQLLRAV